jgi:hypothetical protein
MVIKLADEQRIDLEWPEAIEIAKEQVQSELFILANYTVGVL